MTPGGHGEADMLQKRVAGTPAESRQEVCW